MKYRTEGDRAATVLQTLKNLEAQAQAAELEMIGTGKGPEDVMGAGPDGPLTYEDRINQINGQIDKVEGSNQDLMPLIKKIVDREKESQRQALEG